MKKNKNILKLNKIKDDEKTKKSSNMKKFPTPDSDNSENKNSGIPNNNQNNIYPSDIQQLFERLGIV